jgi:hypothetical protein
MIDMLSSVYDDVVLLLRALLIPMHISRDTLASYAEVLTLDIRS